ncbi:hypothetical protein BBJ28_00024480, partial [Nothophytophthora sp. Chile5]
MTSFRTSSSTLTRLAIAAAAVVALSALTVSAQDGSGSTVTCDVSQYLDTETESCVNYTSRGQKAGNAYDTAIDSGNTAWMLMSSAL